ncbi:translesion error-prone DNA polymerase V autoproteolytic subunit [Algicola sagamiensis]|uniref:translesion error-prone DNA polymerase V autoproteolytic subunit n=1 Tax=Algicola sagamiensis TaxID=163869 RepID=UPI00037B5CC7|nr:translesion error-prone DNA polymerase V autoproteolytic subunit [Algicola sagamiensis]
MRVTHLYRGEAQQKTFIPLMLEAIPAGFPSPAQDYIEKSLDLNELCIRHPAATFFLRVEGDSMVEAGIYSGDILIVNKALTAQHGDIVVAALFGEFTVKTLEKYPQLRLVPSNRNYQPIVITEEMEMTIFGVVSGVVRQLRGKE